MGVHYRRIFKAVFAVLGAARVRNSDCDRDGIATAQLQRPGEKPAPERGSPAAGSVPAKPGCISSSAERARISDMVRPCVAPDAILRHVASWGDRIPHALNKGNALCAVKVKAGAVMLENVRRSGATDQATEACLTQFYGVVAVLWMQRNLPLARIRSLTHRRAALMSLALRFMERNEHATE
jgi:hypothetical protein